MIKAGRWLGVAGLIAAFAGSWCAAGPPLRIEKVWPEKLLYAPGQTVNVTVTVRSQAEKEAGARLRCWLVRDLNEKIPLFDAEVSVPARGQLQVPLYWKSGGSHLGYEACAELLSEGQVVERKREFFAVSDDPWKVCHYGFGLWSYGLNAAWQVERWRSAYIAVGEWFAWAQAHVGDLSPEADEWLSSTGYRESKGAIRALLREAHKQGIKVTSYWTSADFGPLGYEFAREHPTWVAYGQDGRWKAYFDVGLLDRIADDAFRYRTRSDAGKPDSDRPDFDWYAISYNWRVPQVAEHHAREIVASARMFGWDGIRYDAWMNPGYALNHRGELLRPEESPEHICAENIRKVTSIVRKEIPRFLFGYNSGPYTLWNEGQRAAAPGNYMLYENAVALWYPNHVLNNWARYREAVIKTARGTIKDGGYCFVHLCRAGVISSPVAYEHQAATTFAARGHLSAIHEVNSRGWTDLLQRINAFALRYADQLFSTDLREFASLPAPPVVVADERLWWKEYVYRRPIPQGEEWLVHLINPPVSNQPDPKSTEAPEPRTAVKVVIKPVAGLRKPVAWWVSPDEETWLSPLEIARTGASLTVTVPRVKIWGMVLVRWEKTQ